MRPLLADECLDDRLTRTLAAVGYDIVRSGELLPSVPDEEVALLAQQLGRVLLTQDRQIGFLIPLLSPRHPGIVVTRQDPPPFTRELAELPHALAICEGGLLALGRVNVQRFGSPRDW